MGGKGIIVLDRFRAPCGGKSGSKNIIQADNAWSPFRFYGFGENLFPILALDIGSSNSDRRAQLASDSMRESLWELSQGVRLFDSSGSEFWD